MNSLLLVLPYCKNDSALLRKCLEWMAELQPDYHPHSCLLVADSMVPTGEKVDLQSMARRMFSHAETIIAAVPPDKQNWIGGSNTMFAAAARQIQECYKLPWFWFEPDAVPLCKGWLDDFAEAYARCAKRFMGAIIPSNSQPDMPPLHLAGCAIYPPDAYTGMKQFTETPRAFDISAANFTVPRAYNTPLLQHFWGKPNLAPTFRETKQPGDPENTIPMGYLRADARAWHRCKDGTLIDLLRARANSQAVAENLEAPEEKPIAPERTAWETHPVQSATDTEPPKRGPGRPRKYPALTAAEPVTQT